MAADGSCSITYHYTPSTVCSRGSPKRRAKVSTRHPSYQPVIEVDRRALATNGGGMTVCVENHTVKKKCEGSRLAGNMLPPPSTEAMEKATLESEQHPKCSSLVSSRNEEHPTHPFCNPNAMRVFQPVSV